MYELWCASCGGQQSAFMPLPLPGSGSARHAAAAVAWHARLALGCPFVLCQLHQRCSFLHPSTSLWCMQLLRLVSSLPASEAPTGQPMGRTQQLGCTPMRLSPPGTKVTHQHLAPPLTPEGLHPSRLSIRALSFRCLFRCRNMPPSLISHSRFATCTTTGRRTTRKTERCAGRVVRRAHASAAGGSLCVCVCERWQHEPSVSVGTAAPGGPAGEGESKAGKERAEGR